MLMLGFFMVGCSESVTSPAVDEFSSSTESISSDVNSSSSSLITMSSSELSISVSSAVILSSSSATAIVPSSSSVTLLPYQLLADTNFTNTSAWTVKDLGTIIAGSNLDSYLGATFTMAPNLISVSAVGTSAPAFTQALTLPQGYTYRIETVIRIDQVSPTILDANIVVSSGIITSTGKRVIAYTALMQKPSVGNYMTYPASMDVSTCYTKPATQTGYVYVGAGIISGANYAVPFKYSISKISVTATPCNF